MKKLFKITIYSALSVVILIVGFIFYHYFYFHKYFNEERFNTLIEEIRAAEELPDLVYKVYEEEHPKVFDINFFKAIDKQTVTESRNVILMNFSPLIKRPESRLNNGVCFFIAIPKLESEVTQKQCFNWIAQHFDFTLGAIGVRSASEVHFKKPLEELNEVEMKQLLKMFENPSIYSPIRMKNQELKESSDL